MLFCCRVGLAALLACALLLAPGAGRAESLLVLGDSLSAAHNMERTEGWVHLLRLRMEQMGWQVHNASISGETTSGGLARLPGLIEQHRPQVCIIELGANDGLRGMPLGDIRSRLASIVALCADGGEVLLMAVELPPNYGALYTRAFAAIYPKIARREGAVLVPFVDDIAGNPALMQADGLHPNAAAQSMIMGAVWERLQPLLDRG